MERIEIAKKYIARGWPVLPVFEPNGLGKCSCGRSDCKNPGKHPRTLKGLKDASVELVPILEWWRAHPDANIGILTGRESGIVAVDIDPRHGGDKSIEEFEATHGKLPVTLTVKTGSGGRHLLYSHPGIEIRNRTGFLPGVDFKADNAYIVAAGSTHSCGGTYEWMKGLGPDEIQIAPLPTILLPFLMGAAPPRETTDGKISDGSRNTTLFQLACSLRAKRLPEASVMTALKTTNESQCTPKLSDEEVESIVQSSARYLVPWESPIPLLEYKLPPFPPVVEPRWLGEFILAVSESLEVPYELVWSFAFSVLSVAAARLFRIQVKPNYSEPLNIWPCSALEPGNRKSAAFTLCTESLMQWQRKEAAKLKPSIDLAKSQRATEETLVKGLRQSIAKKKGADREAIKKEIVEIERMFTEIPTPPELWTSDCTPEKLGVLLMENNERFGFLSDEGGIFEILGGRYTGGVPNLDLFLKAHAGAPDQTSRMGRTVTLESPALTIGISPQPSVLQDLANTPSFRGRGLLGRFLFTIPRSPLGGRTGETPAIPESILENFNISIRRMLDRPLVRDENDSLVVQTFKLSPEAFERWKNFWKETETKFLEHGELETAKDWGSKLPGATVRLAGLLHYAKYVNEAEPWKTPVSDETMDMAIEISRCLIPHTLAVFGLMSADPQIESAKRILKWIKTKGIKTFTQRDCQHALQSHFKRVKPLEEALSLLSERLIIRELPKQNAPNRTGRSFEVNPAVQGESL